MSVASDCAPEAADRSLRSPDGCAIKTILVPVSGSETDRVVFSVAKAIAQPLQAHLEFLHICLKPEEAAMHSPRVAFCAGPALRDALADLAREQANLSASACNYVKQFCIDHDIVFGAKPSGAARLSAQFLEESAHAMDTLLFHARRTDLTVLGRTQHADCLPRNLTDEVLLHSGRPLLLVPKVLSVPLLDTVVVGWKDSAASARAMGTALPLLRLARRVVVTHVAEDNVPGLKALESVCEQLAWHGITAEMRHVGDGIVDADTLLRNLVAEEKAGLLVIGGFGRSRLRETIFGGVTRSMIQGAQFPLFIAH